MSLAPGLGTVLPIDGRLCGAADRPSRILVLVRLRPSLVRLPFALTRLPRSLAPSFASRKLSLACTHITDVFSEENVPLTDGGQFPCEYKCDFVSVYVLLVIDSG